MTERLTGAEEIELIRKLNGKAPEQVKKVALDKLVLSNMGLAHKAVQKFPMRNATCSYEDLLHEAIAGLIYGIRKFDETRGYRLSTYVWNWVSSYVQRYYHNHGRTVRIPVNLSEKHVTLSKQIEQLTRELGRTPTQEEIQEINDTEILPSMLGTLSLNGLLSEDNELESLQGEDNTEQIENEVDVDIILSTLKQEVSDRDYNMFIHRYGLNGKHPHTLQECSDLFDLTRARIHQIEHGILKQLRELV